MDRRVIKPGMSELGVRSTLAIFLSDGRQIDDYKTADAIV